MKRLFYFLIVLSCTLWSCGKSNSDVDDPNNPDNPDTPTNVTLDISTTDLTFEASGGQKEFTIYCNSDWTITNSSSWCKTDVTNGNSDRIITVTADPYSETADQNTNLTIKAGDKTKVLTVTQKHGDAIILTKDKFDVPQEGENITIEVKSNIEYQVSIPSKFQTWIKQAVKSKALETKTFSFTISANENFDKREGYIVFNGNSLKDTVYIFQAQKNQLILTEDTYNIPSEGKDITVELKTNIDYEVNIPSEATSWLSQITTRAIRTDQLKFHIEPNPDYESRLAKIIIKDKNGILSDTLIITQNQKNTLIIPQKEYQIEEDGGEINIQIQCNTTYSIEMPKNTTWIKQIVTKSLNSDQLKFSIYQNRNNASPRTAQIIIKSSDYRIKDTIIITQAGATVHYGDVRIQYEKDVIKYYGYKKIVGDFSMNDNISAKNLGNTIEEITGNVFISYVFPDGLKNLKTIGGNLTVQSATSGMAGFANLVTVRGNFAIYYCSNYQGLENLSEIGGNFYAGNGIQTFEHLSSLKIIGGDFSMTSGSYNNLKSFKGLENLNSIGGDFKLYNKNSNYYNRGTASSSAFNALESFEGLNNLTNINGSFILSSKTFNSEEGHAISESFNTIKNFKGLGKLKNIGGDFILYTEAVSTYKFYISGQGYPEAKSNSFNMLSSFEGLNNLVSIGGNFNIISKVNGQYEQNCYATSFNELTSFEGLNSLITIGGEFKINATKTLGKEVSSLLKLNNYCALKKALSLHSGVFSVTGIPFTPTKEQIFNGVCSK